jgi:hypothetical protein
MTFPGMASRLQAEVQQRIDGSDLYAGVGMTARVLTDHCTCSSLQVEQCLAGRASLPLPAPVAQLIADYYLPPPRSLSPLCAAFRGACATFGGAGEQELGRWAVAPLAGPQQAS